MVVYGVQVWIKKLPIFQRFRSLVTYIDHKHISCNKTYVDIDI